ncbi:MAG TPA: hypothetical protein VEB42_11780, partial [Chitinophagaceae bacterium]|nr:hypothetical protein [Chitinophagaceae bacterium]
MITVNNYHDKIAKVDFSSMPEAIRKGHEFVKKVTNNGANWDTYHASETIKKTVDTYFEKLAAHLKPAKQQGHKVNRFNKQSKEWEDASVKPKQKAKSGRKQPDLYQPSMVERIPDDIRFIRRFVNMNGKPKTKDDILRFVNSLQKAILEKRIRKTSTHVEHIRFIQDTLIEAYNSMGKSITISLKPETFEALNKAANDEKVMSSVGFMKRYISLNG